MDRLTFTYATHQIPLECDVYSSSTYPPDSPVFLFFHAGGLVRGARNCVPPWLVQVCIYRQWPLISASYRLFPQANGESLLEDVTAAYEFSRKWGGGAERPVVVGGASAGFFCAALIAHHLQPQPLALLSITGIPTFRHPFFNSSNFIAPECLDELKMRKYLDRSVEVGSEPIAESMIFSPDSLTKSGGRNTGYQHPKPRPIPPSGNLYRYFLSKNAYIPMLGSVDPGFEWAESDSQRLRLANWPITIFIHGNKDVDVGIDVIIEVVRNLGPEKAKLMIAEGQTHLFEATCFLEDKGVAMDTVKCAMKELDEAVSRAQK
ncbi:hypothetical protein ANO14919_011470 [Xylariales sp. No.14919]|nr:hypothetical protein ANO14919_011470 [Xylariales sp. No.14919]